MTRVHQVRRCEAAVARSRPARDCASSLRLSLARCCCVRVGQAPVAENVAIGPSGTVQALAWLTRRLLVGRVPPYGVKVIIFDGSVRNCSRWCQPQCSLRSATNNKASFDTKVPTVLEYARYAFSGKLFHSLLCSPSETHQ